VGAGARIGLFPGRFRLTKCCLFVESQLFDIELFLCWALKLEKMRVSFSMFLDRKTLEFNGVDFGLNTKFIICRFCSALLLQNEKPRIRMLIVIGLLPDSQTVTPFSLSYFARMFAHVVKGIGRRIDHFCRYVPFRELFFFCAI
jgi:hypothetical protein